MFRMCTLGLCRLVETRQCLQKCMSKGDRKSVPLWQSPKTNVLARLNACLGFPKIRLVPVTQGLPPCYRSPAVPVTDMGEFLLHSLVTDDRFLLLLILAPTHPGVWGGWHIWQRSPTNQELVCWFILPTPRLRMHPPNFSPVRVSGWRLQLFFQFLNKTTASDSSALPRGPRKPLGMSEGLQTSGAGGPVGGRPSAFFGFWAWTRVSCFCLAIPKSRHFLGHHQGRPGQSPPKTAGLGIPKTN